MNLRSVWIWGGGADGGEVEGRKGGGGGGCWRG